MTDYLELLGAKYKAPVMPNDNDDTLPVPLSRVYEDYEPIETEPPSFWELTKAHFKDNPLRWTIMRLGNKLSGSYEDPDFRVTAEDVVGYEDFPQIMNAKNEIELMRYKELADDIMQQQHIMASRGTGANIAAGLVAGLADPINIATGFVGGGIANTGFKLFRISKKVGKVTKAAAGAAVSAPLDIAVRSSLEEREADTNEYVIGASVSGLMGAAFGVAPSVVRAMNPMQKKKIRKAFENYQEIVTKPIPISEELPQSEIADTHIADALGVQKLAEKVAPDVALANSEFNTAKEFGAKMAPQSFKIENNAGETVAQGATVEMLSQQAMAVDMKTFDGVIQRCFKDWLSETKNYGWCKKTFTNWSSCNLWSGKAWEEFCESVVRHLEQPDGIVAKPIQTASDFFKSKVDELTEKGLKAGIWNDNFEALKVTWEREQSTLTKQRNVYEKAVTDTQNISKFNEETADAVTYSIYKLQEQIDAFQDKKLRVKDLLAKNAKPLSEARKDYRNAKVSTERAEVSGIRKFGEMEGLGKANRVVDKNKASIDAKASGLEQMVFDENAVLSEEKTELTFLHKLRPRLTKLNQQLRERIEGTRHTIYDELNSVIAQLTSDTVLVDARSQKINSQPYHPERARLGKMTERDARITSKKIQDANKEINNLRKRIAENIKTKKEVPAHIIAQMKEVEDQIAYVDLLETELRNTENVLKPLERIDKAVTEKVFNANARLQKIVVRHEEKRVAANVAANRIERREHIKNTLRSLNAHYEERIADLKADITELSKTLTEFNRTRGRLDATMARLGKNKLTAEQTERLSYLDKRLANPKFTMADISNIKDPIYFPRIYNLGKIGKSQKEFADVLMRAYRAEGDQSSEEALRASVNRTIDKLLHVVKAGGENKRGQRRFELGREIDIPTYYLNDYIEKRSAGFVRQAGCHAGTRYLYFESVRDGQF